MRIPLLSERFHFNNNRRQDLRQRRFQDIRKQEFSDAHQYQDRILDLERQISELRLQVCLISNTDS